MMFERFRSFSLWIVILAISVAIFLQNTLFGAVTDNVYLNAALVWVSGVLGYQAIANTLFTVGSRNKAVLSIFYGPMFLDGFWSYTSHAGDKYYLGVWRIEQDLYETKVTAFGLDDAFGKRSSVQSVATHLKPSEFIFVNERTDWDRDSSKQFSKTVAIPDEVKSVLFFERPVVIRGETQIYGGPMSGQVATNVVFRKHTDVRSFDALIDKLRKDPNLWRDQGR
jgi:hypothetical protein